MNLTKPISLVITFLEFLFMDYGAETLDNKQIKL